MFKMIYPEYQLTYVLINYQDRDAFILTDNYHDLIVGDI